MIHTSSIITFHVELFHFIFKYLFSIDTWNYGSIPLYKTCIKLKEYYIFMKTGCWNRLNLQKLKFLGYTSMMHLTFVLSNICGSFVFEDHLL